MSIFPQIQCNTIIFIFIILRLFVFRIETTLWVVSPVVAICGQRLGSII